MMVIFVKGLTINTEKGVKWTMSFIKMESNTENKVEITDYIIRT